MAARRRTTRRAVGLKYGWRSGLEERVGAQLASSLGKGGFGYESLKIPYVQPEKERRYTPDFELPNGIIIETKGRFETGDRQKHIWIQEQYPDLDIRFVFSNPNSRISKQSQTTYAIWCQSHDFLFAKAEIPGAWIRERPNRASLRVLAELRALKLNQKKT